MELFCQGFPAQVREHHLQKEFTPILLRFGIRHFHVRKCGKTSARLTILESIRGQAFLDEYSGGTGVFGDQRRLILYNCPVKVCKSNRQPETLTLRHLEYDKQEADAKKAMADPRKPPPEPQGLKKFPINQVSCGYWFFSGDDPIFYECFHQQDLSGRIVFRRSSLKVTMSSRLASQTSEIEFAYSNILSMFLGDQNGPPSFTITSDVAPRLFRSTELSDLRQLLGLLNASPTSLSKSRVSCLSPDHAAVASTSFTYRFMMSDHRDLTQVEKFAREHLHQEKLYHWSDLTRPMPGTFSSLIGLYATVLERETMPWTVKFQIQRLICNGDLSPLLMFSFIQPIKQLLRQHSPDVISEALQKLTQLLTYPSPNVSPAEVDLENVVGLLQDAIKRVKTERNLSKKDNLLGSTNLMIHHAEVTPCGIYLSGPFPEVMNRVLRKHAANSDHFLRVTCMDEMGERVHHDPKASIATIFHDRFKSVLKDGIAIGEKRFVFLGFSHSSLRAGTCWFVSPFFSPRDGIVWDNTTIMDDLGDFRSIRSAPKMSSRQGQTFSDTLTSIPVPSQYVRQIKDVERNGHCFSDGVGTISLELMRKIWKEYALREPVKPTVFQIRCGGAKGMISYDSRLTGSQLVLRDSMVKFETSGTDHIEICGSGVRPLSFCLNCQLIKILEDLGVDANSFLALQATEVSRLRSALESSIQAAEFIETSNVPKAVNLPWLIETLHYEYDMSFSNDPFLRSVTELSLLSKLRDLKYRARIAVDKAVTLYGIMDETGVLREKEIYVPILQEDGSINALVQNNVVITRSPALHPGDVQYVNAVDVPYQSPLRNIHNCIVFSQYGERDLPSMLSGGDLDGDLYNVIYDATLMPRTTYTPADYKRVPDQNLGRSVTQNDIIDFFVTFMEQDQLGRLAILHQINADQTDQGTLHPDCLLLAQMNSTAVDFSKTGQPIDIKEIPKDPRLRIRPDFLAPGPRVEIAENINLAMNETEHLTDVGDDDDELRPLQYYRSQKVLGKLYRNIDENKFLRDLEELFGPVQKDTDLLTFVSQDIATRMAGFQWKHIMHLIPEAESFKAIYEDNLLDIMSEFSSTPWKSRLTEHEVFIGHILGVGGKVAKRDRDLLKDLRDRYTDLVDFTINQLRSTADSESRILYALACLYVAIKHPRKYHDGTGSRPKKLLSFGWIVATLALRELQKWSSD